MAISKITFKKSPVCFEDLQTDIGISSQVRNEEEVTATSIHGGTLHLDGSVGEDGNPITIKKAVEELRSGGTDRENRLDSIEAVNTNQDTRLDSIEDVNTNQDTRLDTIEDVNTNQDNRLDTIEDVNTNQDTRLDTIEDVNTNQDTRLDSIEDVNTNQDTRLDSIEIKDIEQDNRLESIETRVIESTIPDMVGSYFPIFHYTGLSMDGSENFSMEKIYFIWKDIYIEGENLNFTLFENAANFLMVDTEARSFSIVDADTQQFDQTKIPVLRILFGGGLLSFIHHILLYINNFRQIVYGDSLLSEHAFLCCLQLEDLDASNPWVRGSRPLLTNSISYSNINMEYSSLTRFDVSEFEDTIIINNSRLINMRDPQLFRGWTAGFPDSFKFRGTGNYFHLLDSTRIYSNTWAGNTVDIPFDTGDNYYSNLKDNNPEMTLIIAGVVQESTSSGLSLEISPEDSLSAGISFVPTLLTKRYNKGIIIEKEGALGVFKFNDFSLVRAYFQNRDSNYIIVDDRTDNFFSNPEFSDNSYWVLGSGATINTNENRLDLVQAANFLSTPFFNASVGDVIYIFFKLFHTGLSHSKIRIVIIEETDPTTALLNENHDIALNEVHNFQFIHRFTATTQGSVSIQFQAAAAVLDGHFSSCYAYFNYDTNITDIINGNGYNVELRIKPINKEIFSLSHAPVTLTTENERIVLEGI